MSSESHTGVSGGTASGIDGNVSSNEGGVTPVIPPPSSSSSLNVNVQVEDSGEVITASVVKPADDKILLLLDSCVVGGAFSPEVAEQCAKVFREQGVVSVESYKLLRDELPRLGAPLLPLRMLDMRLGITKDKKRSYPSERKAERSMEYFVEKCNAFALEIGHQEGDFSPIDIDNIMCNICGTPVKQSKPATVSKLRRHVSGSLSRTSKPSKTTRHLTKFKAREESQGRSVDLPGLVIPPGSQSVTQSPQRRKPPETETHRTRKRKVDELYKRPNISRHHDDIHPYINPFDDIEEKRAMLDWDFRNKIHCLCLEEAALFETKKPLPGLSPLYYACAKSQGTHREHPRQCNFFRWTDFCQERPRPPVSILSEQRKKQSETGRPVCFCLNFAKPVSASSSGRKTVKLPEIPNKDDPKEDAVTSQVKVGSPDDMIAFVCSSDDPAENCSFWCPQFITRRNLQTQQHPVSAPESQLQNTQDHVTLDHEVLSPPSLEDNDIVMSQIVQ